MGHVADGPVGLGRNGAALGMLTLLLVVVLGSEAGVLVGVLTWCEPGATSSLRHVRLSCLHRSGGLMVMTWPDLNTWNSGLVFALGGAGGGKWMVFRGLLIGRLPLAWSQAGMVAFQRRQLHGPHGAISCFERGWDADEEHLNPMAYVALHRIHLFLEDERAASDGWRRLRTPEG